MDSSLLRTAQNHPNLKILNLISMAAMITLNILMVIANPAGFPVLLISSASTVLFIINVLFYLVSEGQRELIIKYRVFTVFILTGLVIFFCFFDLIRWIIEGPYIFFKWAEWIGWILSIIWIILKTT